ncbi:uncharacterized protein G2W53_017615 [Senna tora]|uniref:CCHC-type domain-containing protein n=1 Tax=Senna tora TaxID=362788 RepID=A0A834TT45_9FABA|nr:uncharacterized protein G2W53_017615 [Senna tora]
MVDTRSGRRGRIDSNPIEQIAASIQALTARMDQQQELIMQQQQTIQQLNEILAKREQEKVQGSTVRIERGNENEPEVTPQAHPSQLPPPPPPPPSCLHEQEKVPTPPLNQPQLTNTQALNEFKKYNPPEFDGKFDVQKAETWLMKMEKMFEILEGVLQVNVLTWESFLAEFYEKYFPGSIQDEKETEFINLKQEDGDMSVDTYVAKFIQLSRYSSYLMKCDDEPWKIEKLERGFKPEIRDRVAPQQIRVFNKLVEIAWIIENNLKRMGYTLKVSLELKRPREEESSVKNNKKNGRGPWNKKGNFKGKKRPPTPQTNFQNSICPQCGKQHGTRPCLAGQGVYYKCGKPGHMARDCSQQKDVTTPSKSQNQGTFFALTQQEASQYPSMI